MCCADKEVLVFVDGRSLCLLMGDPCVCWWDILVFVDGRSLCLLMGDPCVCWWDILDWFLQVEWAPFMPWWTPSFTSSCTLTTACLLLDHASRSFSGGRSTWLPFSWYGDVLNNSFQFYLYSTKTIKLSQGAFRAQCLDPLNHLLPVNQEIMKHKCDHQVR